MEDYAGSWGHTRPKHAWTVFSTQKIKTFDGRLRPFPAFLTTILDPTIRKKGHKVRRTCNSSRTAFLGFVKMRESLRTRTFDRTPNWTTLIITCTTRWLFFLHWQSSDYLVTRHATHTHTHTHTHIHTHTTHTHRHTHTHTHTYTHTHIHAHTHTRTYTGVLWHAPCRNYCVSAHPQRYAIWRSQEITTTHMG